jgi:N-methylhydantoinase B
MSSYEPPVSPAIAEVIRNYQQSAANEMQRTLIRTTYNTAVYEMLDLGISICDANLNLVADSPGLTMFLGANDYSIKKASSTPARRPSS